MTTNGSAAVAVEAASAERILHKLRDKGRKEERAAECAGNGTKGQRAAVVVASLPPSWPGTYLPGGKKS